MPAVKIGRPAPAEYAPYFGTYIDKVGDGDILALLRKQIGETMSSLASLSDQDAMFRYAPGKWSVKEVVGHISDTERIFVYRALCFARNEKQALPGFDENEFVAAASFDDRPFADHLAELQAVRAASLAFFSGLNEKELGRTGLANQKPFSVRAIPYIVAGHEKHHVGVLRERYLGHSHR